MRRYIKTPTKRQEKHFTMTVLLGGGSDRPKYVGLIEEAESARQELIIKYMNLPKGMTSAERAQRVADESRVLNDRLARPAISRLAMLAEMEHERPGSMETSINESMPDDTEKTFRALAAMLGASGILLERPGLLGELQKYAEAIKKSK